MTENFDCFFYGTLMFPEVLLRVLQRKEDDSIVIEEIPAILKGYKRLKVLKAPYPAIIKDDDSETRGIVIKGLTSRDISILDRYEGFQYKRIDVEVFPIDSDQLGDSISVQTYVWRSLPRLLEDQDWDPEGFKKEIGKYLDEEDAD